VVSASLRGTRTTLSFWASASTPPPSSVVFPLLGKPAECPSTRRSTSGWHRRFLICHVSRRASVVRHLSGLSEKSRRTCAAGISLDEERYSNWDRPDRAGTSLRQGARPELQPCSVSPCVQLSAARCFDPAKYAPNRSECARPGRCRTADRPETESIARERTRAFRSPAPASLINSQIPD